MLHGIISMSFIRYRSRGNSIDGIRGQCYCLALLVSQSFLFSDAQKPVCHQVTTIEYYRNEIYLKYQETQSFFIK